MKTGCINQKAACLSLAGEAPLLGSDPTDLLHSNTGKFSSIQVAYVDHTSGLLGDVNIW